MLALKLVQLIERHSAELAAGLTKRILESERTCDFRRIPPHGLELAAAEVYRNLGQWLLYKTDTDISERFQAIAANRVANGVGLHQFVWALVISRDHLWQFLQENAMADGIVELYGRMELERMLNRFFDSAMYYGVLGGTGADNRAETRTMHIAHRTGAK
jgi:hypothetical protein